MTRRPLVVFGFVALACASVFGSVLLTQRLSIGEQPDGSIVISTSQTLTPVGKTVRFDYQRPKDLAVSPNKQLVAILAHRRLLLLDSDGASKSELAIVAGPLGIAWAPDGKTIYASTSGGKILVASWDGAKLAKAKDITVDTTREGQPKLSGDPHLAGLAVSPDGAKLYVASTRANAVFVVDAASGKTESSVPTGVAPYHVALSAGGKTLAVSNRGGFMVAAASEQLDPATNEPFIGTGVATQLSAGTPVQIDPATDAAWRGTVTLLDTGTMKAREISVQRQPSGLRFSADGKNLYVAESDSDSLSFVDVAEGKVTGNLSVRPPTDPEFGQIPTDVIPGPDGSKLYVTLGGVNAVAVVENTSTPKVAGYIPTGWFPIGVDLAGDRLFVVSSKGIGSRPSNKQTGYGVHDSVGLFQAISPSDMSDVATLTKKVAVNNRWNEQPAARARRKPVPLPERLGEPSVFKHVVYIIKENLTYDSALGDMKEGNGDPSLCTFGADVSPNHHALAKEFVLLDNFYTSGTNSADGHQWTSASVANGYIEQNYSSNARSYPYDGGDALVNSPEGFLWTAAAKAGKSVRVYGEFVNKPKVLNPATNKAPTWTEAWQDYKTGKNSMIIEAHTDNAALRPHLHPNFIGFPSIISDQWRTDQYLKDLAEWEKNGKMPNLTMMLLPNDHTSGTSRGMPTPRASVADNDLALGRIVEAISKSRFWKETLILVVQDDSQLGLDHVDGHRSIAFCISPFTKRGQVVSDMYNHTSFIRTLDLVLGIPPMNRFDRNGMPLTSCFTDKADLRPYSARKNTIPLDEMNPNPNTLTGLQRELALECERLDWSDVDRAHASTVAKSVWYAKFPNRPFPAKYYNPPDDQEEEEEED